MTFLKKCRRCIFWTYCNWNFCCYARVAEKILGEYMKICTTFYKWPSFTKNIVHLKAENLFSFQLNSIQWKKLCIWTNSNCFNHGRQTLFKWASMGLHKNIWWETFSLYSKSGFLRNLVTFIREVKIGCLRAQSLSHFLVYVVVISSSTGFSWMIFCNKTFKTYNLACAKCSTFFLSRLITSMGS